MKKLLVLVAILFTITLYGEDELPKEEWEVAPGIISGGYSKETGPYIFKIFNIYTCPSSLAFDRSHYYIEYYQSITNIGYGEYKHHGGGGLISYDNTGKITKVKDGSTALSYGSTYADGGAEPYSPPAEEYDGRLAPAYVYKKELISPLLGDFYHENYNIKVGQLFRVGLVPTGGSGFYSISVGSKPAFLVSEDFGSWSGVCFAPAITSFLAVVTDIVTGETRQAFATIIISEDPEDPTFPDEPDTPDEPEDPEEPSEPTNPTSPSNPSNPSDPSDPSNPSDPSEPTEPSEPVDPSNPDSPDSPSDPTEPDNPDEPDPDDVPEEPETPDTPSEPADPSNPDSPDEPNDPSEPDSPDTPDSPDIPVEPDKPVVVPDPELPDEPVVVPDSPETPDEPEDSESSDISDESDPSDEVIIIDPLEPGNEDDEPVIIVVDRESSDSDKIIVTDDGVTTVQKDNHDLAIFLGMFGAITGISGSANAPKSAPMAVQQARQEARENK